MNQDYQPTGPRTAPVWWNWSQNLEHKPATSGDGYYFRPTSSEELRAILEEASAKGLTVRVSGQRHSQPPLVADDNRDAPPASPETFLIDMSCYIDLGDDGIELGPGPLQVTVNPGIREDFLDVFLANKDLMLRTVTAGGFFSLGGMTAVDVHGATIDEPIFAETATAFTIMNAEGVETVIDANSPGSDGWSPLQFARVSLGGLGIVTRITLDVLPRPYATTLEGGMERYLLPHKKAFSTKLAEFLTGPQKHTRMEVFYTPYAAAPNLPFPSMPNFLVLWWDVIENPQQKIPNSESDLLTACSLSESGEFGAPLLGGLAKYAVKYVRESQYFSNAYSPFHIPPVPPSGYAAIALDEIESQVKAANAAHSDLWLTSAQTVIFMSYFIELPGLDETALGKVWDGLDVVAKRVIQDDQFHIVAPLEFRFVRGGDSAMAGTYSDKPNSCFVNLDLIAFVDSQSASKYPAKLLQFFADVEREWVGMGGFPHNGKMYGFYDPDAAEGAHSVPFNKSFIRNLRARRGERLQAFAEYRKRQDPGGLFYNKYLRDVLEG